MPVCVCISGQDSQRWKLVDRFSALCLGNDTAHQRHHFSGCEFWCLGEPGLGSYVNLYLSDTSRKIEPNLQIIRFQYHGTPIVLFANLSLQPLGSAWLFRCVFRELGLRGFRLPPEPIVGLSTMPS